MTSRGPALAVPQPPPKHPMASALRHEGSPHTFTSDQPFSNSSGHVTAVNTHVNEKADGAGRNLSWIHHVPTIRQWIQDSWLDIIAVIAAGILSAGMNLVHVSSTRQFPINFRSGEIVYPEFAYPRRNRSIVPIWLDALMATLIPTLFFVIAQIRVKSFYDLNVAFWGNIWSVITATLFQVFLKVLIGGFRPHFLTVCNPDIIALQAAGVGTGYQNIMFDRSICRPTDERHLQDAMKSFPSGHSAAAMAGFVYLALYFNAKMKIFSDERPHFYKFLVFLAPLLGATLICCAMTVDNAHHWYDVVVGAAIGIFCAFCAFRMSFASVWDHRFNHIPLPRAASSWNPFKTTQNTMGTETYRAGEHTGRFEYALGPSSDFRSWARGEREMGNWAFRGAPGDAARPIGY